MPLPEIDTRTFADNILRSRLLSAGQLQGILAQFPAPPSAGRLAKRLIKSQTLTRFQVELLLQGQTDGFFIGPYRLLDNLGRGGLGRVFKAQHPEMNRLVAVKVLAPKTLHSEKAAALFQREVLAASRLQHPHIVAARDAGRLGGRHYLVMEYVAGPNLEQLVRRRGPLPCELACEIIRQVASGLQYAHELGMLHRDIKPANILVQKDPVPNGRSQIIAKLADFGLARLAAPGANGAAAGTILASENTVMGTPDYLSPEQARNLHAVDIRADLYSLGCTLYHLLTGQPPFVGGTKLEKLLRHASEAPAPVQQQRPEVSAELSHIVHRLLAKKPAERFQTPAELVAAMTPLSRSAPSSALTLQEPKVPAETEGSTESDAIDLGTLPARLRRDQGTGSATWPPSLTPTVVPEECPPQPATTLTWRTWLLAGLVAAASFGIAFMFGRM